jgi:ribosomal protein S12 methylthiotransferase accessory factor
MPQVGVTHVLELTALDSLGLPVCMAFGPLPAGSDLHALAARALGSPADSKQASEKLEQVWDSLETFPVPAQAGNIPPVMAAGKGLSGLDARVSAMMEAVERYSARQVSTPTRRASYREMAQTEQVIDPRDLLLISPAAYDENQILEWVEGFELNSGQPTWVPVEAATFAGILLPDGRTFVDTPTGLGAGNVLEEAVCHGLAEAIEHDAWALAVARQSLASAESGLSALLFHQAGSQTEAAEVQNSGEAPFRQLDLQALERLGELNGWLEKIGQSGGWVRFHDITSDVGVPVISASLSGIPARFRGGGAASADGPDGGGLGAHPDGRVALARALTEAAQQRLILGMQRRLQALRADQQGTTASRAGQSPTVATVTNWSALGQAAPGRTWQLEELHSAVLSTIQEDIEYMLQALKSRGNERAVVVTLNKPGLNTPVVKVVVPGLADYWNSAAPPDWQAIQRRLRRQEN